ncbi:MAG: hypothetical protein RLZZ169_805 [Pseudomonadota bacterium]|jgi:hypothetical protein
MGDVLPFQRKAAPRRSQLCANGHHRWAIWQQKPFDTRQGKLVTVYRCARCGAEKVEAK